MNRDFFLYREIPLSKSVEHSEIYWRSDEEGDRAGNFGVWMLHLLCTMEPVNVRGGGGRGIGGENSDDLRKQPSIENCSVQRISGLRSK